ncbi:MAG: UPF0182 family protein [Thermodesulfobacteriota bacterium]
MTPSKRITIILAAVLAAVVAALALFTFVMVDFIVDLWWFDSLHLAGYFWLRHLYRFAILIAASLGFSLLFAANFFIAARYLGTSESAKNRSETQKRVSRDLFSLFLRGSMKIFLPFSVALGAFVSWPLYSHWEETLLFLFGRAAGRPSVLFGHDVSYFLFSYPVFTMIQARLVLGVCIAMTGLVVLYVAEKRLLNKEGKGLPGGARAHLSVMVFFLFAVFGWGFYLEAQGLLYSEAHQPVFAGPGYVEWKVVFPLILACIASLLGITVFLVLSMNTRRGKKPLYFFAVVFALAFGLRHTHFLYDLVEQYSVKPNEIAKEMPYIENSIQATLEGFGLDLVITRPYPIQKGGTFQSDRNFYANLQNVPVWDQDYLKEVYFQIQGIRPYYNFSGVDVDRYTVAGQYQQVYLASREITLERLPGYAQNWINAHLRYTHGQGVVMTPAAQGGDEGMTWFIKDVPPQSSYGFSIQEPDIYYGCDQYPFVIAPNATGELDAPAKGNDLVSNYTGTGGVPINNLFRKAIFALYFSDKDSFFTTKTIEKSRILFRRNIVDRIRRIAPFLKLDQDPYTVVTSEGIYWIQDAYTTSRFYPNADIYQDNFNYIRNSVKIVVDAFSGQVRFYIADPADPIVMAYYRMYPGLLSFMDRLPASLRAHLRYPKDMFTAQMDKYGKYHQTDPKIFYQQQDIWEFAKMYSGGTQKPMGPYYLTLDLIKPGEHEFLLVLPVSPIGRDNLRSLAIGRCDGDNYGKIVVYSFPEGQQIYGPSQTRSVIDIDTMIAQEFTLWDQAGSEVKRGRMVILPMVNRVFYVQPVYLRATNSSRFPELKRIIVALDDVAVMDTNLEKAFERLEQKYQDRLVQKKKQFPEFLPGNVKKPASGIGISSPKK